MYHQSTHPPQPASQSAAQDSVNSLQLPQQVPPSFSSSASSSSAAAPCLFAFPLESNFSGARYDPAVVRQIQTSGLAVTPCACSKASEQQCSLQSGVQLISEEEQQSGQQQVKTEQQSDQQKAKEEQQCGQQQQSAEEEPQPAQQQQQHQTKEEQQHSVQQLQAAAEEEKWQYAGQLSEEEAARLRVGNSGRSEGDRWHVLIDAAKACTTAPPDLTQNPADFVVSQCPLYFANSFLLPSLS